MASLVKVVARFSEDAIQMAIGNLPIADREATVRSLEKIYCDLTEKTKREEGATERRSPKTKKTLSKKEKFTVLILPLIKTGAYEAEMAGEMNASMDWSLSAHDYAGMTIKELKIMHRELEKGEEDVARTALVIAYHKGKLYYQADQSHNIGGDCRVFFKDTFNVNYETARRYMAYYGIVQEFPGLIVARVTYTQMVDYSSLLRDCLAYDEPLRDRLTLTINVNVGTRYVEIASEPRDTACKPPIDCSADCLLHDHEAEAQRVGELIDD